MTYLDHSHCWESSNPPCGQKIKHFECCLCKKENPEISSLFADREAKAREKLFDKIEAINLSTMTYGEFRRRVLALLTPTSNQTEK